MSVPDIEPRLTCPACNYWIPEVRVLAGEYVQRDDGAFHNECVKCAHCDLDGEDARFVDPHKCEYSVSGEHRWVTKAERA